MAKCETGQVPSLGDMRILDLLNEPCDSNLAWQAVSTLFPNEMTGPGGEALVTGAVPLFEAMAFLSTTLMLFGVWMVFFHTIHGITETAHQGKVLGNKFHQIWAPLRVVLGFGFLVPAGDSGMSGIHYVVKYAAIMSINLADGVWSRFVTTVAQKGVPLVTVSAGGDDLAWQVLQSETCRALVNAKSELMGSQKGNYYKELPDAKGKEAVVGRRLAEGGKFVDKTQVYWDYGSQCGALVITMPEDKEGFAEKRRDAVSAIISSYRAQGGQVRASMPIVEDYVRWYGGSLIDSPEGNIGNAESLRDAGILPRLVFQSIRDNGKVYDALISKAASEEAAAQDQAQRSRLVTYANERGFLSAGVYWQAISQISKLTTAYSAERPRWTPPRLDDKEWGELGKQVKQALDMLNAQRKGEVAAYSLTANDAAWAGDKNSNIMVEIIARLNRPMSEWVISGSTTDDPFGRMVSFGHYLLIAGEGAIVLGIAAAGVSGNIFGDGLGIADAVRYTLDWANWPIGFVMIAGLFYAYILPTLPFLFLMYLGFGWFVKVLEALIAGTLWCFAWIRMDGDELVTTAQRQGGMLMFNLILVPVNAILAFCGAFILIRISLNIFGELWALAALGNQGGNYTGLLGTVTLLFVRLYMELQIVMLDLRLITSMHERISAWFGVPTTSLGEDRDGAAAVGGLVAAAHRIPVGRGRRGNGGNEENQNSIVKKPNIRPDNVRARGV